MISAPRKNINRRKPGGQQRRCQNVLEVKARARVIAAQRYQTAMSWSCRLLLVVGAIFTVAYGVRVGLRRFLWENPEYALATVVINDDGPALSREAVMSTAGLRIGQNVFSFSLAKAREAVAALPLVDHVEMTRVLPNKVIVELAERHPVAWVSDGQAEDATASDKSFLIDSKRVLFKPKRRLDEYLRLPVISGVQSGNCRCGEILDTPETTAALALIQRNSDSDRFRIQCIDISKGYCLIATDAKRTQVTFGLEKLDVQLERLGAILDRFSGSHQEIQTVNLLAEKNIPVTFAPSPEQQAGEADAEPAPVDADQGAPNAESAPARDDPPKHAVKSPTPAAKKKTPPAETHERKKKSKHDEPGAENRAVKHVVKREIRRAEAADVPAPTPAPVERPRTIFSFFHGQR